MIVLTGFELIGRWDFRPFALPSKSSGPSYWYEAAILEGNRISADKRSHTDNICTNGLRNLLKPTEYFIYEMHVFN